MTPNHLGMHMPSLRTPDGTFDYFLMVLAAATLFFAAIFAAIHYGLL